ncbi:hypothetical protein MPSEU_000728400 [Mayamaea pseudoterrestris]|nr:hypothetical protein MPSEU_000728400 [Mayamaea pseudoterrestris]
MDQLDLPTIDEKACQRDAQDQPELQSQQQLQPSDRTLSNGALRMGSQCSSRQADEERLQVQQPHLCERNSSLNSLTVNDISPPRSKGEVFRDLILRLMDSRFVQLLGYLILFLVVLDGAIFFFFLMGWQTLCRPRIECEPRNDVYNISVQILNGLFTYMAIVAMPWRCANGLHVFGLGLPPRDNSDGKDLYGIDSPDIWFHVPRRHRRIITTTLLMNCIFQFINQGTRIVFWNYGLQDQYPGNLWTNIFFGSSMLCAAVGALHIVIIEGKVQKRNPELFEPGPIQQFSAWCGRRKQHISEQEPATGPAATIETLPHDDIVQDDLTQNKFGSVLGPSAESVRGGLRMFGL